MKDMMSAECQSKQACLHIKNYATACPVRESDINKTGVYCPPTPKVERLASSSRATIFCLNNSVHIDSSPKDKSIHISIHRENGVWRIGLIPGFLERKRLDQFYSNKTENQLLKVCRETKVILTKRKSALRICRSVLAHQEHFFHEGIAMIKPLSLLDVALDVSLDESCVSRYSNKVILHTPHGTIKLRYLFNRQGYSSKGFGHYSKIAIQMKMKNIVEQESGYKKVSDSDISRLLKKEGIDISRRAVTKYRLEMGIPSSRERRHSCTG